MMKLAVSVRVRREDSLDDASRTLGERCFGFLRQGGGSIHCTHDDETAPMGTLRIDIASEGISLEGISLGSAPPRAVIAPPHPLYGGHLSNPVVEAIGLGLLRRGVGAIAFNWRGVGLSQGRASGEAEPACEDFRAALAAVASHSKELASSEGPRCIAAGYSFGAATALAVALDDERVSEVIAVAPPVAMLPRDLAAACRGKRVLVVAAEHDDFGPPTRLAAAFASIASARVMTIAGADHFFSHGDFDGIADAVASCK